MYKTEQDAIFQPKEIILSDGRISGTLEVFLKFNGINHTTSLQDINGKDVVYKYHNLAMGDQCERDILARHTYMSVFGEFPDSSVKFGNNGLGFISPKCYGVESMIIQIPYTRVNAHIEESLQPVLKTSRE